MTVQPIVTVDRTGSINPVTSGANCASGGDSFPNTGSQYVFWNNTSGGSITITEVIQATVDGQPATGRTFALAAGAMVLCGPFPTQIYNDGSSNMNFTYSVNPPTGLKMTVLQNTTN